MRTISLALLIAGCNPGSFQDYLDTAPIRVAEPPKDFRQPNYGRTMVALNSSLAGEPVGRVIVSGGGSTPLVFIRSYANGKVSESTFSRCRNDIECANSIDIGATMIPFERWGSKTTDDQRELCVFAPANGTNPTSTTDARPGGNGYVACEAPSNHPQSFALGPAITDVRGDEGTLKYSGFGLPPAHPLGVVLLGVHAVDNRTSRPRNGGLYVLPDLVYSNEQNMNIAPFLERVQLVDPSTKQPFSAAPDAGDFGVQVAGALAGNSFTFAVAQPSKQRVIVASYDDTASGAPLDKFRVRACIQSTAAGFGSQLQVADITGDSAPEIVVASDQQKVFVYDGSGLPNPFDGDVCPAWKAAPIEVACAANGGPSCDGYGASLAVGDVDADGKRDLIIGAPLASVGGKPEVGAIWIVPGSAGGPDVARALAVTVATQAGARFGWNVAALHTQDRDEPVASAPGIERVFTIMCTPLEDAANGDKLCLE